MRRLALAAAAVLACAGAGQAHEGRNERALRGTVRPAEGGAVQFDLLATLSLSKPASALYVARFDLNRDGQFDATESALAGVELAPRALAQVAVRAGAGDRAAEAQEVAVRLTGGRVEVAVLSTWREASPGLFAVRLTGLGAGLPFAVAAVEGVSLRGATSAALQPGGDPAKFEASR